MSKVNDPKFVTQKFCDERTTRIIEKLEVINGKVDEIVENSEKKGRDWRLLGFAILGSVVSGGVVAAATYIFLSL